MLLYLNVVKLTKLCFALSFPLIQLAAARNVAVLLLKADWRRLFTRPDRVAPWTVGVAVLVWISTFVLSEDCAVVRSRIDERTVDEVISLFNGRVGQPDLAKVAALCVSYVSGELVSVVRCFAVIRALRRCSRGNEFSITDGLHSLLYFVLNLSQNYECPQISKKNENSSKMNVSLLAKLFYKI